MADKSLRYVVSAIDKGAGKTIGDVATHGSKAASTIGSAFGKMSGVLGGEVGDLASKLQEHFDSLGEHGGHGLAAKLEVGGAAMLGIGSALSAMGAAEKQSTDQLETAVTNTGHSFEDVSGKVDAAVGHMEKYGFTAIQTKDALTTLTNATHDPQQALSLMGEAADLAASRHMTLNAAADQLAKTVNGSTRLYKLYGIQVQTNADGTKNLTLAQQQLAQILHGQADSAANNFTGKLKQLRAEVENNVAEFGEKYGPAITAAGAALTLLTPIMKGAGAGLSKLSGVFRSTSEVGIAADEAAAASTGELSDAVATSATSQTGSFTTVATGAEAASSTAINADEEAEASTTQLAGAVQASATAQTRAFAQVASAAESSAAATVGAEEEVVAAEEEAAASSKHAALGATLGLGGVAIGMAAVIAGGFALSEAIDGTNNVFTQMESSLKNTKEAVTALQTKLVNSKGPIDGITESWAKQAVQGVGLEDAAAKVGITLDQVTTAVTGNDAQMNQLIATWKKSGSLSAVNLAALIRLSNGYRQSAKAAEESRAAAVAEVEAVDPLAAKLGLTNSALKTAEQAAGKTAASNAANTLQMQLENNAAGLLSASLDKLNGRTLNVEQANIAFRNANHSLTDAVKQNGHALTDNTQKGRNNRSAILDSITAAQAHAEAIGKQTGSTQAATEAYKHDIDALKRHLEKLGLEPGAIQRIIDKYGRVPTLKKTKMELDDEVAREKAKAYIAWLEGLPSVTIGVNFAANRKSTYNSQVPGGHAGGSDFFAGGATLIAEREPEIVDLPRGSTITPLSKMPRGHYERQAPAMDWTPMLNVLHDIRRAILDGQSISLDGYAVETAMGRRADRYRRAGG